jgi:hypothetical protein
MPQPEVSISLACLMLIGMPGFLYFSVKRDESKLRGGCQKAQKPALWRGIPRSCFLAAYVFPAVSVFPVACVFPAPSVFPAASGREVFMCGRASVDRAGQPAPARRPGAAGHLERRPLLTWR